VKSWFPWTLIIIGTLTSLAGVSSSIASVPPSKPVFNPIEPSWQDLTLRVDITNLMGDENKGKLPHPTMVAKLKTANRIWAQCGIQFTSRQVSNVSAEALKVPFVPKSQDDLGNIYLALHPKGVSDAIPLMIAGSWQVNAGGMSLMGLGWAFASNGKLDRLGAMVDANQLNQIWVDRLISHELGHALSLSHHPDAKNVMAGGEEITRDQCLATRGFTEAYLASFIHQKKLRPTQIALRPRPSRVN
jgi:hypothetical protein